MDRASTEAFIRDATERLRGPMSNLDRALLVADRKDARDHLETLPPLKDTPHE